MSLRNLAHSAVSSLGLLRSAQPEFALRTASLSAARLFSSGATHSGQHRFPPPLTLSSLPTVAEGYKYAASHEWAKVDGDIATVGISDHAQSELGDVVYVELPDVGKAVKAKETFGVVESVKAASDVYSPVSGEVVEVNTVLADSPATINKDPYKAGWIMKVKMSNKGEVASLMDAAAYTKETAH